jgi:hypothetical protein
MDEETIIASLMDACNDDNLDGLNSVVRIEDSGYASYDNGFVIQSDDGREFAVIVKQWR